MATKENLEQMLNEVLSSNYRDVVRALGSDKYPNRLTAIKSGGAEYYFNLSPNKNFSGRMVCMSVSSDGDYRLGASFGKIRHTEDALINAMKELTRNNVEYGTDKTGKVHDDIIRCKINTCSEDEALKKSLKFYDQVKDLIAIKA